MEGVRNHQAAANLRAMQLGERVFFYRSMVEPAIVGVMTVSAEAYPDPDDPTGKFVRVKVKPLRQRADGGVAEGHQGRSALCRLRAGPPVAAIGGAGRRRALARLVRDGRDRAPEHEEARRLRRQAFQLRRWPDVGLRRPAGGSARCRQVARRRSAARWWAPSCACRQNCRCRRARHAGRSSAARRA